MADALDFARASLESHGHMALEWLQCLVEHDESCKHIDPLLCSVHVDLSQKFNIQLKMMNDCRDWIKKGEAHAPYDRPIMPHWTGWS